MSFFTQSPRFGDCVVQNGTLIHTPNKSINQPQPTTTTTPRSIRNETKAALAKRERDQKQRERDQKERLVSPTQCRTPGKFSPVNGRLSPSSLNRPTTPQHTSSFGLSNRSDPLSRSTNGGFVVVPRSHSKKNTPAIGPGSYTDCHYRGSPDVCASTMLHKSFNVKAQNGNGLRYTGGGMHALNQDNILHSREEGNRNIYSTLKKKKKKSVKGVKKRLTNKTFSKPYDEFAAEEEARLGGVSGDIVGEGGGCDALMISGEVGPFGSGEVGKGKVFRPANPNPIGVRPHSQDLWSQSARLNSLGNSSLGNSLGVEVK